MEASQKIMGVASQFQHGLSWLSDEDEPCSKQIRAALGAAIFCDTPNSDVVRALMQAYDWQMTEEYPDKPEPKTAMGADAEAYLRTAYLKAVVPAMKRRGIDKTEEDVAEYFNWPESLPLDYPIRKKILDAVATRMATADADLARNLRRAALQEERVKG